MKRYLIAVVLFLLAGLALSADSFKSPKGFVGKLWDGTFALYSVEGEAGSFACTAEIIGKSKDGYVLLSAGHCVAEGGDFAVSENIDSPLLPVTVIKSYRGVEKDNVDFALLDLKTTKKYPVMQIGNDDDLRIGDSVIDVHFSLGFAKQLSYGRISSKPLTPSYRCTIKDSGCLGDFMVQDFATKGASGSAVISAKTHQVIGILVSQFDEGLGTVIEPISNFVKFTAGPNQFAAIQAARKTIETPIRIPEDVYHSTFGPEHPFTLTVTGPNPRFTQGGYTFVVDIMGLELFEDYYTAPVFIGETEDGTFHLVCTKSGYSVNVAVVQGPEQK